MARQYRGLGGRTRRLLIAGFAVGLGAVFGATARAALDSLTRALAEQQTSLAWYGSRLLAFLAYLALAASVMYGLMLSTGIFDAIAHRPVSVTLHQDLAVMGLALSAVHGSLLLLDRTIQFTPFDLVVPFSAPYRPLWVGLGQVAFWISAVIVASFQVRRWIGPRAWRALHYVTFLAFATAAAHGVLSGTDTREPWAWGIYVVTTVAVGFLTTYRVVLAVAGGKPRPTVSERVRAADRGRSDREGGNLERAGDVARPLADVRR